MAQLADPAVTNPALDPKAKEKDKRNSRTHPHLSKEQAAKSSKQTNLTTYPECSPEPFDNKTYKDQGMIYDLKAIFKRNPEARKVQDIDLLKAETAAMGLALQMEGYTEEDMRLMTTLSKMANEILQSRLEPEPAGQPSLSVGALTEVFGSLSFQSMFNPPRARDASGNWMTVDPHHWFIEGAYTNQKPKLREVIESPEQILRNMLNGPDGESVKARDMNVAKRVGLQWTAVGYATNQDIRDLKVQGMIRTIGVLYARMRDAKIKVMKSSSTASTIALTHSMFKGVKQYEYGRMAELLNRVRKEIVARAIRTPALNKLQGLNPLMVLTPSEYNLSIESTTKRGQGGARYADRMLLVRESALLININPTSKFHEANNYSQLKALWPKVVINGEAVRLNLRINNKNMPDADQAMLTVKISGENINSRMNKRLIVDNLNIAANQKAWNLAIKGYAMRVKKEQGNLKRVSWERSVERCYNSLEESFKDTKWNDAFGTEEDRKKQEQDISSDKPDKERRDIGDRISDKEASATTATAKSTALKWSDIIIELLKTKADVTLPKPDWIREDFLHETMTRSFEERPFIYITSQHDSTRVDQRLKEGNEIVAAYRGIPTALILDKLSTHIGIVNVKSFKPPLAYRMMAKWETCGHCHAFSHRTQDCKFVRPEVQGAKQKLVNMLKGNGKSHAEATRMAQRTRFSRCLKCGKVHVGGDCLTAGPSCQRCGGEHYTSRTDTNCICLRTMARLIDNTVYAWRAKMRVQHLSVVQLINLDFVDFSTTRDEPIKKAKKCGKKRKRAVSIGTDESELPERASDLDDDDDIMTEKEDATILNPKSHKRNRLQATPSMASKKN